MSLTILHLNPILELMIEMIRESRGSKSLNFFIFQICLYLREIMVLSGSKMFYFIKKNI